MNPGSLSGEKKSTFVRPSSQWRALPLISWDTTSVVCTGNTHKTSAAAAMFLNKLFGYCELLQNAIKILLLLLKGTHLLSPKAKAGFPHFCIFFSLKKTGEEGFTSAAARQNWIEKHSPLAVIVCTPKKHSACRSAGMAKEITNSQGTALSKRNTNRKPPHKPPRRRGRSLLIASVGLWAQAALSAQAEGFGFETPDSCYQPRKVGW